MLNDLKNFPKGMKPQNKVSFYLYRSDSSISQVPGDFQQRWAEAVTNVSVYFEISLLEPSVLSSLFNNTLRHKQSMFCIKQ